MATRLAERGDDVHLLIRATTDRGKLPANIPTPNMHVVDGSAETMIETVAAVAPEITFHLAGRYVREPADDEIDPLIGDNFSFGITLLEGLRRAGGACKFVNTGSYAQYFDGAQPRPLNLYAATKQAFEDLLSYYIDAHGFSSLSLILHDTYGPGDRRRKLLTTALDAQARGDTLALPDEDVSLNIVHVDDVVAAFERAATLLDTAADTVNGRAFFVSLGRLHKISEIVEVLETIGGKPIAVAWGRYRLPARRISAPYLGPMLPGWRARVALADGVRALLLGQEGGA